MTDSSSTNDRPAWQGLSPEWQQFLIRQAALNRWLYMTFLLPPAMTEEQAGRSAEGDEAT